MGWVWLNHPDLPGGPERFPDDPEVIRVQKARGWEQADDPAATASEPVEPDEVDDRGQGWVDVRHAMTGGVGRIPVEVFGEFKANGWESVAALEAAEAKKKAGKKTSPAPVGDDTTKEK